MYEIKFQDIVKECNEQIRDAVKQCKSKEELLDYFKGVGILPLKNAAKIQLKELMLMKFRRVKRMCCHGIRKILK